MDTRLGHSSHSTLVEIYRSAYSEIKTPIPHEFEKCVEIIRDLYEPHGELPKVVSTELYLIQGLSQIPGAPKGDNQVIYQPQFLFFMDFGFEAYAGVAVPWNAVGLGDPKFPNLKTDQHEVRSVLSRSSRDVIFPLVAGSLVIGIERDVSEREVREALAKRNVSNVEIIGETYVAAKCQPFYEVAVARKLQKEISFVRYAQANHVVRLIDFEPGWKAVRLI